jgi:hypothetical protein
MLTVPILLLCGILVKISLLFVSLSQETVSQAEERASY